MKAPFFLLGFFVMLISIFAFAGRARADAFVHCQQSGGLTCNQSPSSN